MRFGVEGWRGHCFCIEPVSHVAYRRASSFYVELFLKGPYLKPQCLVKSVHVHHLGEAMGPNIVLHCQRNSQLLTVQPHPTRCENFLQQWMDCDNPEKFGGEK